MNALKKFLRRPYMVPLAGIIIFIIWFLWPMSPPVTGDFSRVVYDRSGKVLRVTLADDAQVRFPLTVQALPEKYVAAVTLFEDRRFFSHPGVDLLALGSAMWSNLTKGNRFRGGSTLTMQVVRLSHPRRRTYWSKILECFTALKLTLHYSKKEILSFYAAQVPMGGNIAGAESASRIYFDKPVREITWAEAALFSVLPNAPSMINLQKSRKALKHKRDRLLRRLYEKGRMDSTSFELACLEPLPQPKGQLPFTAPHFTQLVLGRETEDALFTTLDDAIQKVVEDIAAYYTNIMAGQGIYNIAVVAAETKTGAVRAYVGSHDYSDTLHQGRVDGVQAYRSTGSLLKPFLAACALDRGPFNLNSKLLDVPTYYGTFSPQNAAKTYGGLVTMRTALVRSLNVPFARLLAFYGIHDFYRFLQHAGMHNLFRSADQYGLPLILGGAEASLWELTGMFAMLGNMGAYRGMNYLAGPPHPPARRKTSLLPDHGLANPPRPPEGEGALLRHGQGSAQSQSPTREDGGGRESEGSPLLSSGAAWQVLTALKELQRPGAENYWHLFTQQVPVAWKTGTSYGQKDAWAVGVNRQWTIGVWMGNFSGEGNSVLYGSSAAGPVLFALFNQLSDKAGLLWFEKPQSSLVWVEICPASGLAAGPNCSGTVSAEVPAAAYKSRPCPFHQRYLTDSPSGHEICSRCWNGRRQQWSVRSVYPPSVQTILNGLGIETQRAPIHNPDCPKVHRAQTIELVYPVPDVQIWVPRNLRGEYEKVVLKAEYHAGPGPLYWYLDGGLLGETYFHHTLPADLEPGAHRLVVEDPQGSRASVAFRAFKKEGD